MKNIIKYFFKKKENLVLDNSEKNSFKDLRRMIHKFSDGSLCMDFFHKKDGFDYILDFIPKEKCIKKRKK